MKLQGFAVWSAVMLVAACMQPTFGEEPGTGEGAGGSGTGAGGQVHLPASGGGGESGSSSGGAVGMGGSGGEGGVAFAKIPQPHCTPEEEALAWKIPDVPFRAGIDAPVPVGKEPLIATVVGVDTSSIDFEVDGEVGRFRWPNSLPFSLDVGADVKLARSGDWNILVSDQGVLSVLVHDGFGSIDGRFPEGPTSLLLATHCHVPLEPAECESETPHGYLYSLVVANNPLGLMPGVVARPGATAQGGGWTVENHGAAYFPGSQQDDCIVESLSWAYLSAFTLDSRLAPF